MNKPKKHDPETESETTTETATDEGQVPAGPVDPSAAIVDYERRLQEAETRALRIQADQENFRRRTRRELDDQLKYAALPLMTDLIEVVDNLARALSAAEGQSGDALVSGVRMVQTQLEQMLEKNGCRRIATLNMVFDPNVHSALEMRVSDTVPPSTIIEETRSGYQLHDRVVRPAHVIVSTGPAN